MELTTIETNQNVLTLSLEGDFDATGARAAQPHIDSIISTDEHSEIEIDFNNVKFLDSSGVGAMVYLYKRLVEHNRSMRIENAKGQPLEIIKLLRIGHAIPVNSKSLDFA
ncbi:STAS domain-containing protein [Vibrio tapetis]|uniref:Anti-anti-sigma regulatory factor n=1 Tax=Vibrio tapetis subsp. tapetis TaxID=1671868 RepID=A0A2N8ZMH2_9VIBR|nr:STAS domain-containing protein [Vibrio tapetis]SON53131.1 Anti-anti-sigma regulatory factor [Vibrio tapetis subsp. tapetis]